MRFLILLLLTGCAAGVVKTPTTITEPVLIDAPRLVYVPIEASLTAPITDPAPWAITWLDARRGWEARGVALFQCNARLGLIDTIQGREAN